MSVALCASIAPVPAQQCLPTLTEAHHASAYLMVLGLHVRKDSLQARIIFSDHLDKCPIPSTFHYSTVHSLPVLTRPLADVSAPKHTAIWPAFIS